MPQRRKGRRVLGPYPRERWERQDEGPFTVVVFDGEGGRSDPEFATKKEVEDFLEDLNKLWSRLDAITVEAALTQYRQHLEEKGTKAGSADETLRRLRLFFSRPERLISSLTKDECERYYVQRDADSKIIGGFVHGRSVDYHRNTLIEARSFLRWCVGRGWLRENPLEHIQGIGRRSKGKAQLTADESYRFMFAGLWMANAGDTGALGAVCLLLMGLRQSEVWKRRVRDLDRGGTVLRIEDAKTKAGERVVRVPELLQPYMVELGRGRLPLAPLFAAEDGGHHTKAWLRFAVARVCTAAGVPRVTPHGLRGTFASLGEREHVASDVVARAIGHAGMSAYGNYAQADAVQSAASERVLSVIQGGKR